MTSISNIRMTKARGLVLALALAVFLASASPAGAWFYFDTSGSYAPGKFDYSYPILTFEPLIGGGVDYHLDSGQAQLCASSYNGTQKITVQANVYKWNTTSSVGIFIRSPLRRRQLPPVAVRLSSAGTGVVRWDGSLSTGRRGGRPRARLHAGLSGSSA